MGIEPPDRGDDNIPRIDSQPRMGVPDEGREEGARRAAALNRKSRYEWRVVPAKARGRGLLSILVDLE